MADEINVGRLVAEFVLEAETKKAEEQFKNSAENIKSSMKNLEKCFYLMFTFFKKKC